MEQRFEPEMIHEMAREIVDGVLRAWETEHGPAVSQMFALLNDQVTQSRQELAELRTGVREALASKTDSVDCRERHARLDKEAEAYVKRAELPGLGLKALVVLGGVGSAVTALVGLVQGWFKG